MSFVVLKAEKLKKAKRGLVEPRCSTILKIDYNQKHNLSLLKSMDFATSILHLLSSGAAAYVNPRNLRDPLTRPNTLALYQLAESGSVPFLEALQLPSIGSGRSMVG